MHMTPAELKAIRKAAGLTQAEFGKRIGTDGVSRLTVANWESGKYRIPSDIAARLGANGLVTAKEPAKRAFNITFTAAFYVMQRRELAADHQQAMAKVAEGIAEGSLQPFTDDDKLYLVNKYDDILQPKGN